MYGEVQAPHRLLRLATVEDVGLIDLRREYDPASGNQPRKHGLQGGFSWGANTLMNCCRGQGSDGIERRTGGEGLHRWS